MREDYEETLNSMFPDGYCIVYVCKDEQVRVNFYNPHLYKQMEEVFQKANETD